MKAFYFATEKRTLRYGDGRAIIVGETHTVDVEPIPCQQGLHASKQLLDALFYAPGTILYLVELSGEIVETDDKVCATSRTYLAEFDATELLVKYGCQCALNVIEKIKPYTQDYQLIVEFLKSPTACAADATACAARAVYAAAYATACAADDAAYAAARAADAAAYAAARAAAATARAAYAAARAADAAAYAAARAAAATARAAYAAARAAYAADATACAAGDAAYADARAAARVNQNFLLTKMVKEATGWDI